MPGRSPRTPKKRARDKRFDLFLDALETGVTVSHAAKTAGFARRADVYEHRAVDEAFAERWDSIVESTTEDMEREAYRRAVAGWVERPVLDHEGNEVGEVRKFSDVLLMFLLKSRRPEVYREHHRVQHVGADGSPLAVELNLNETTRRAIADALRLRPASG